MIPPVRHIHYSITTDAVQCFSPSTSVFPCQYHSTNAAHSFSRHRSCIILAFERVVQLNSSLADSLVRHLLDSFKVTAITIKGTSSSWFRFTYISQVTSRDQLCCNKLRVSVCHVVSLCYRVKVFSVEFATGWRLVNEGSEGRMN
jgi:hypothetical protein